MKTILITGACGYLGAKLVRHLSVDYKIIALGTKYPNDCKEWLSLIHEFIVGDIRDEKTIQILLKKNVNFLIHLISLNQKDSNTIPNEVSSINVTPTWNLLENFTKNGLEKFIYFSTIHVYGSALTGKIIETDESIPFNFYSLSHYLSENISNYYNYNTETDCINLRLSNSYGSPEFRENNCWWLVINDLCKMAYNNNQIKLLSDGSPQRDFIHINDICRSVSILLKKEKKNTINNLYNISSGETLTILELAEVVKNIFYKRNNKEIEILMVKNNMKKNKKNKMVICNEKLKKLDFNLSFKLEDGILDLFNYLEIINEST